MKLHRRRRQSLYLYLFYSCVIDNAPPNPSTTGPAVVRAPKDKKRFNRKASDFSDFEDWPSLDKVAHSNQKKSNPVITPTDNSSPHASTSSSSSNKDDSTNDVKSQKDVVNIENYETALEAQHDSDQPNCQEQEKKKNKSKERKIIKKLGTPKEMASEGEDGETGEGGEQEVAKGPLGSQTLLNTQIIQLITPNEYYFCEENLMRDLFMRRKMDENGYLPVKLIANFHRVRGLTTDLNKIITAITASDKLELLDNFKVKRRVKSGPKPEKSENSFKFTQEEKEEFDFQFDEELDVPMGRLNKFTIDWSEDEGDDYELSDHEINKLLIVTQTSQPSRSAKHDGHDRTGDWTTRVKMTQDLEQAINIGLQYYEENLWTQHQWVQPTSNTYKTVTVITQEAFEKIAPKIPRKSNPEVPPPPPPSLNTNNFIVTMDEPNADVS
ncbi:hypothetical protein AAG570_007737 [Ranatra chinensis]|uniref:HTH La-type RNA-binding domain-containing protein n=1 Tax=Ranatra chinensis TaxID=642074 RepID=A0ABD0Y9M9_9HEMI